MNTTYIAKPTAGSTIHTENVPEFATLIEGINYYVTRGWRCSSHDEQHATMELWLDHSDAPSILWNDVPDHIVFIGPNTYSFLSPF